MRIHLKNMSSCILAGTTILTGMTSAIFADENRNYTDHETFYVGTTEYNLDGSLVDTSTHICNYVFPATEDTNKDETSEDISKDTDVSDTTANTEENKDTTSNDSAKTDESSSSSDSSKQETKQEEKKTDVPYVANTWYHPTNINPNGYTGEISNAIKEDSFLTSNWDKFKVAGNPFSMPQCTYFAWSRFYQVYGYDSGARGNGKTNAMEIVKAHGDKFTISSTPSAGAVFSAEKNTLEPEYGHVGFIEAYDGTYVWISEGNYTIGDTGGYIYIHKQTWASFKAQYPDVVFAVPNEGVLDDDEDEESVTLDESDKIDETVYVHQMKFVKSQVTKPIYDENGKQIKTYSFTEKKDEIKTPSIYNSNGKKLKTFKQKG